MQTSMKKRIENSFEHKQVSEFKDLLIFFNPKFTASTYISTDNSNNKLQRIVKKNPKVVDLIKAFDCFEIDG